MSDERSSAPSDVVFRAMRPDDEPEIIGLLSRTLGWEDDRRHRELLDWKHRLNPFGVSPAWVAEDADGIAGFRAMMRWRFMVDGSPVLAVRAVDTATHPRAQGRGIFRALTLRAIGDLEAEGVAWVFNTPNGQSAPGYLSMGWTPVGRLPLAFRPAGISVLPRLLSARVPGDLWSLGTSFGESAEEVLRDREGVGGLLESNLNSRPGRPGIRTDRSAAFLEWRYGMCPVGYRVLLAGDDVGAGMVLFRLRRRGARTEALLAETILADPRDTTTARRLRKSVLTGSGADYAVALGSSRPPRWIPAPKQGPLLTWRRLRWAGEEPGLERWHLGSGDVELF